ncbi:E3 ubiquitin-protein ligase listerin, partial [Stylophora pistillata]
MKHNTTATPLTGRFTDFIMGGKDKQRTKGNAKPSSSGRAAALISKDGTVGFVGFGGLQGSPGASNLGYVPMSAGVSEDVDASVDGEFRMVMRKLMKRDSVTKLKVFETLVTTTDNSPSQDYTHPDDQTTPSQKAVQEFTELCKNLTVEAVESALPFWPRLFNKLALDVDHKVREATQQAMEQLVLRVGRNLAPHLRYIIGPWLCTQFDTYAVVASSARKSFHAAFSEEKQTDVIMFCRKELFEFFQDNILTQTSSTLSDPKFVSEEEREAKYNRVLSSSILGLGHLMNVTSQRDTTDMVDLYLNVLRQNKFWKYARHKSPHVRAAVFSTVSIACEVHPSMMISISSQVSPAVLSALDDSDPVVCQQLWNAVLSLLTNITDCWIQVKARKAVLPKLWSVLKNGGNGCATMIFPNLLPFLSKLPSEVIGSGVGFYREFFTNIQEGLTKERVQNSPSECSAIIAAFMECLKFCLLHEFEDGSNLDIHQYLIKEQLLSLLKESLEKHYKLMYDSLYPHVADLLSYLSVKVESDSKTGRNEEEEKSLQKFCHMLRWFWEGFSSICLENLKSGSGKVAVEDVVNSVCHCLVTLKFPTKKKKKKKQHRVAFMELSSSEQVDSAETDQCSSIQSDFIATSVNVEKLYKGCLLDLVCNICTLCMDEIAQNNSTVHLKLLSSLIPHFTSTKLVKFLLENSQGQPTTLLTFENDNYCILCENFLHHTLFPWIKSSLPGNENDSSVFKDSRSVDYLISILCGIITALPLVKQVEFVSESLQQNNSIFFLYKILEKGLRAGVRGVESWLQNNEGKEKLLDLSSSLIPRDGRASCLSKEERVVVWRLLKLCVVTSRKVVLLGNELVDQICQHFLRTLKQSKQENEAELLMLLDILQLFLTNCENNTQWLLVPLLERKILISSDVHDLCDESENVQSTLTNHQKVIVFSSTLIVKTLSNSDETSSRTSDVITTESLICLWLETSWVRHWCTCVLGSSDVTEELVAFRNNRDQIMANVLVNLNHSSSRLLQQIKENQWSGSLISEALRRSRSEGFLWCLVLDGVLRDLRQLGVPSDIAVLLAEVQSLASLEEKQCQTLNTLLSHVDGIYELKVTPEQFIALMLEDSDENGFARIFAIIDGALHQWLQQTKGVEEAVLEYQLTITETLDELVEWNKTHDNLVLVNSPLHDASTSVLTINLSLIRILEKALLHCSDKISGKHWDFILCTLAGWLQTCEENRPILTTSLKCVALCCQVSSLFCIVARFFEENASKIPKVKDAPQGADSGSLTAADTLDSPRNIFTEWQEFFSGTLFNAVLQLFLFHAGEWVDPCFNRRKRYGDKRKRTRELQGPLVMKEGALSDEKESETAEGEDEAIRSPPTALMELINSSCAYMTEMVHEAHVPFGEHLDMTGDTEAQIVSLALMLAWKVLLQFFRSLSQEKRVEYAKYIKQNKMVDSLLCVLFRLIPLKSTAVVVETADSEPDIRRLGGQRTIQQLACGLFYSLLQWMPAIVRQWWNSVDKRQSAIVDKFTTSHITPQLCQREMQLVQNSSIRFDNMQVKARPNAREVAAVYTIEEISMELVVKLAPNHPLGVVSVESGKKIGVTAAQWRSWMLQMTTFLTHQ